MEIRKFVFSIISRFDAKGFREADKAADAAGKTAARTAKYWAVLAKEQLAAARAAETAAKAQTAAAGEAEKAAVKVSSATKKIASASGPGSLGEASKALDDFKGRFAGIGTVASTAAIGLGAFVTAGIAVASGVISTGASFESLRTQLRTLLGSTSQAEAAFAGIKDFAKATPFEVDGVTRAFIALKTRGVLPTTDVLTSLGDLSSSFGGDLEQIVNAISGAARGETDPLERFVSGVKVANGKITLSFRDQKVIVDQNVEAITAAVAEFGKLEGVQGAMAAQSKTTNGVISNLKDAFSQFLDEVAQLGVLDEFKALLSELIGLGGPGTGFAGILADFLVSGLRALREQLAEVTAEDIKSFLQGMANAAETGAAILGTLSEALRWIIEVSGGASDALFNMSLVAYALTAALSGPAGLVLAAAAVGLAMGNLAANILSSSTAAEVARAQIEMYSNSISEIEGRLNEIDKRVAARQTKSEEDAKKREAERKAKVQRTVGGLGAGLSTADTADDAAFRAQQIIAGNATEAEQGKAALLTAEGRAVFDAVNKAQKRQADKAAENARREASKRGASEAEVKAAENSARSAAASAAAANRQKAFEAASTSFAATGSASKAAKAGENVIEGAEKKATGGGKAGKAAKDDPYDFVPKARAAAKSQAEKFAAQEFERLVAMGVDSSDVDAQGNHVQSEAARRTIEAARAKEEELTAAFVKAGKIFETDTDNILSLLGLNKPGTVLEGRPPPSTLIIAPVVNVTMIKEFNQQIGNVSGAAALSEITGQAGQAAVNAGLKEFTALTTEMIEAALNTKLEELLEADGDGEAAA